MSNKKMSCADFDRLDPVEKALRMKGGLVLFDEASPKKPPRAPRPGEMLRSDFDQLDPIEKAAKMKGGLRLIDGDAP